MSKKRNYKVVWPNIGDSFIPKILSMSENKALNDTWMLKHLPGSRIIVPADAKHAGI